MPIKNILKSAYAEKLIKSETMENKQKKINRKNNFTTLPPRYLSNPKNQKDLLF
jgi:hypothetical protein